MREIKEKPVLPTKVKEKVKAAPKELTRRGLSEGADRLRVQLRDAAQHGQRDDMGQNQLEDNTVNGIRHLEHGGEHLLQKAKKDRSKSRGKVEHPEPTEPHAATAPEDTPTRIKTREAYRQWSEETVSGQALTKERGREQMIKQSVRDRSRGSVESTGCSRKRSPSSFNASAAVPEEKTAWEQERSKERTIMQTVRKRRGEAHLPSDTFVLPPRSGSTPPVAENVGNARSAERKKRHPSAIGGRAPGRDVRVSIKGVEQPASASKASAQAAQTAARKAYAVRQITGRTGRSRQAVQFAGKGVTALTQAAGRTLRAMALAAKDLLATLAGGGSICAVLVMVLCVVGLLAASPFGILFAGESGSGNSVPVSAAVAQVNYDFNAQLEELQTDGYDSIAIEGQPPEWPDILAVFAVYVTGGENAVDVAVLDADRVARLKAVFWDMTSISSTVDTTHHPDSDPDDSVDDSYTEKALTITITAKTAEEMVTIYGFTQEQIDTLHELLEQRDLLTELAGETASLGAQAREVLRALPDDLAPERRAVVGTACSLVGKVNYFWGGKSLVLGWDSRWGQLQKVWAAGSSTTGTYRPYGMDCSGFVDWVFYNASGGDYIIGHGGGASAQHSYCTPISWDEAIPGDFVFYPGDSHVGIVGGRDEAGDLLIIHCASGYNNVVITGLEGFTSIGRPRYFAN